MISNVAMCNFCGTKEKLYNPNIKTSILPTDTQNTKESNKLRNTLICLGAIGAATVIGKIIIGKGKKGNTIIPTMIDNNISIPRENINNSFEALVSKLDELGLKSADSVLLNCTEKNFLGSGANSNVYKFTDEKMENWAIKVLKCPKENSNSLELTKIEDRLIEMNMGQPIAKFGERILILKRIKGIAHAIPEWASRGKYNIKYTQQEAENLVSQMKKIADFPTSSFDNYAIKLKLLDERGFKMDSFNPNNILVNHKTKELSIIDYYNSATDTGGNTVYDLIAPLTDFKNFGDYYSKLTKESQKKVKNIILTLNNKCIDSAKKVGLETNKQKYLDFLKSTDEIFKLGDLYYRSFCEMEQACLSTIKK